MASGVAASAARVVPRWVAAGDGPGADDADEGVAGQGVGDGGQGPDGQVPPAGSRRDRVHEHAGGDRGQVQRPGAERPAAVQGQGDAEAGEDQRGGVRDGGFQGGDRGQVAAVSAIRYWAVKLTAAAAAAQAPVFCLCDAGGEMAALYLDSFERVWANSAPLA